MPTARLGKSIGPISLHNALEDHPGLGHVESDDEQESVTLTFPRQTEGGFDVIVEATPEEIILFAHGAHVQFDRPYDEEKPETQVEEALGLARDLLSPAMRIRERCAVGKPYRWSISLVHRVPRRHAVACGARDRFAFLELFRSPL